MPAQDTDTIAAIATPAGRGAVGIVRLSGPRAFEIAHQLTGAGTGAATPSPRTATLRTFRDARGEPVDRGLLLTFPAPHSYTGEDVAELQGHGGPVVLDLLLRAACALGARLARPGEFSERAFLNGMLDLAQAEAVADLIDAQTAAAARAAQRSLSGEFSARVQALRARLEQLRVHVEGALDFSDEDVAWLADEGLRRDLQAFVDDLRDLLRNAAQGRRLREGLTVALAGQPNVGKSTLLNRLAGTEAAIVTEVPGTTRDPLREHIALDGLPLTVIDTAGLRESDDRVERIGIERAWQAIGDAEVVLYVADDCSGLTTADRALLQRFPAAAERLIVLNKTDLSGRPAEAGESEDGRWLRLSAQTGTGLDQLTRELHRIAGLADAAENPYSARRRHVEALQRAAAFALDAQARIAEGAGADLAAEELRLAHLALGEITGQVSADDLLGMIFRQFCIGK